jgi:hypothetical protein
LATPSKSRRLDKLRDPLAVLFRRMIPRGGGSNERGISPAQTVVV